MSCVGPSIMFVEVASSGFSVSTQDLCLVVLMTSMFRFDLSVTLFLFVVLIYLCSVVSLVSARGEFGH